MKGIIIHGNPMWGDNERATFCEFINEASFDVTQYAPKTIISSLKGETSKLSKTVCSKDDTYDFETGALIALMKMCGVDKVVRACNEAFSEDTFKTYTTIYERELNELKKDFDKVRDLKDFYKKNYEDVKEHYGKLGDRNKYLIDDINKKLEYIKEKDEEIKKLKSDKDKSWKNYQRNIQKKQGRINELNNIEEEYIKLREEYDSLFEEKEKLQHEYDLCKNSENALKYTVGSLNKSVDKLNKAIVGYKNDLYNTAKRCKALEAENEKLKLDCEKLRHGYVDIDNVPSEHWDGDILDIVFLPGRACGKQYKALVALFKKLDQKKVDAAYKEAYNTTLPVWQKEALRQAYEIHKESKEKTELPRTLDINGTTYRKSIQIKDFGEQITKLTVDSLIEQNRAFTRKCVDEWLYKIPTKREEMWDEILKEGRTPVYVKRKDIHDFLEECQIAGIKWQSGKMPLEAIPFDLIEPTDAGIYFFVMTSRVPNGFRHVMTWWTKVYDEDSKKVINYLPPMRWDLFKKGRLAVKVNYDNYKEFYEACEREIGKKPMTVYTGEYTVGICKKDGLFEVFTVEHPKNTGKKIVNWEDVRENKTTTEDPYDTWKW